MKRRGREMRRTGSCRLLCQVRAFVFSGHKLTIATADLAANMIGRSNARRGARRIFAVLQNRRLNQHIVYTIIDEVRDSSNRFLCNLLEGVSRFSRRCSQRLSKVSDDTFRCLSRTIGTWESMRRGRIPTTRSLVILTSVTCNSL